MATEFDLPNDHTVQAHTASADTRHTFAVRRLLHWYRTEDNVQAKIPSLSTYMGYREPARCLRPGPQVAERGTVSGCLSLRAKAGSRVLFGSGHQGEQAVGRIVVDHDRVEVVIVRFHGGGAGEHGLFVRGEGGLRIAGVRGE
ncbi:hypothetical protein AB0J08_40145, partial [Kitasatospora sp. NPDC050463]